MYKLLFLLTVAVCASASSIVTVTCNGVTTTDPFSASCTGAANLPDNASGTASLQNLSVTTHTFSNPGIPGSFPQGGSATASASITQAYVLTVASGPANIFFRPCISVSDGVHMGSGQGSLTGNGANFSATSTFGALSLNSCNATPFILMPPAPGPGQNYLVPIAVNASQTFFLTLMSNDSASAGSGNNLATDAFARVDQFQFFDPNLNPLVNVTFTFAPAGVPEPSFALVIPLAFLGLLCIKRRSLLP